MMMAASTLRPAVRKEDRKKATEQTVLEIQGHGDGIHFITGFYIELNFISDPPCYRRIRDSGTWCDQLLRYDAARSQWTIADFGPPPKLRAAAVARNPPLQAWEGQEWHLEGSDGGLQIQKRTLNQLSKDARREAKEVFRNPLALTQHRAQDCPTGCNDKTCKTWGCANALDLYAHLCLFHRRSPQYYELHERYWNESVAEALRDREETSEELLHKFADFMKKHGYEKKTQTMKVKDHERHLKKVEELVQQKLSRQLPEDDNVFETIKGTQEDISSHGHYSTSLRWFRKWVEISVIEEVLALGEDVVVTEPTPVALPAKRRRTEQKDELDLGGEDVKRNKVSEAKDPFWAILQLDSARVRCPREGAATAKRSSGAQRNSTKRLDGEEEEVVVSRLSKWYGQISEGNLEVAKNIASRVEKIGEKTGLTMVLRKGQLFHDKVNEEILDQAWLWSYAGTSDRSSVLKTLCGHSLNRWGLSEGFNYLLKRLLCVARSPNRSPVDILECAQLITTVQDATLRVNFKQFEKLAGKVFRLKLKSLRSEDRAVSVKLLHFGSWLAQSMRDWPDTERAVTFWWSNFSNVEQSTLLEWYHRCCFATGFVWNFCPNQAPEMMEPFLANQLASDDHRSDLRNLQRLAAQAFKKAQSSGALGRQLPVPQPGRDEQRGSLQDAQDAPVAMEVEQVEQVEDANDVKTVNETAPAPAAPPIPSLSSEAAQRAATIQRNKAAALERKRLRQQHSNPDPAPAAVQQPAASAEARPVARPLPAIRDQTIDELDKNGRDLPIVGQIQFRSDHKTGTGFHVRVSDKTGAIDVKFFEAAANAFRAHPALVKGATVRISGFKLFEVKGRALDFAPAGRRHELRCNPSKHGKVELLGAPGAKAEALQLAEALRRPDGTIVTIARATVSAVEELEEKQVPSGETRPFRVVWLVADDGPVRWSLWNEVAVKYGPKQLMGQNVKIKGTKVKLFRVKELTGCWRDNGIEILND